MKAMSLRIRIQTLSPGLTPSSCRPPAMRSARSATSACSRRCRPLMMPRKGDELGIFSSLLCGETLPGVRHCEERSDEAIQLALGEAGLLRCARNDGLD